MRTLAALAVFPKSWNERLANHEPLGELLRLPIDDANATTPKGASVSPTSTGVSVSLVPHSRRYVNGAEPSGFHPKNAL